MTTPSESVERLEDAVRRLDAAAAVLAGSMVAGRLSPAAVEGAALLAERALRDLRLWTGEPHPEAACS